MKKHKPQANVPALRFPEFRECGEWNELELGSIGKVSMCKRILKNQTSEKGDIPFYKIGTFGKQADAYINRGIFNEYKSKYSYPNQGDILISASGTIGRLVVFNGQEAYFQDSNIVWIDNNEKLVSNNFLYYCYKKVEWSTDDNTISRLYNENLRKMKVFIPSPKEQQKIADCLSSLDALITAESEQLTALKTHKTGLMQQLFPSEGETSPKLRFPEFRESGEWVSLSIDELVEKNILFPPKDGNHGNIHPKSSDYVDTGIPFVMANDLKNGSVDFLNCSFIAKHQADSLQKGFSKAGDVLLTHKGTVGEVALVERNNFPYIMLTPQVTYYRIENKEKLSNNYLKSWFLSSHFQSLLKNVSGGGTRAYIGITAQGKLIVKLPKTLTEQKKIADCLSSLDDLINAQAEKIELLKLHKKGLMQQLFPSLDEVGA